MVFFPQSGPDRVARDYEAQPGTPEVPPLHRGRAATDEKLRQLSRAVNYQNWSLQREQICDDNCITDEDLRVYHRDHGRSMTDLGFQQVNMGDRICVSTAAAIAAGSDPTEAVRCDDVDSQDDMNGLTKLCTPQREKQLQMSFLNMEVGHNNLHGIGNAKFGEANDASTACSICGAGADKMNEGPCARASGNNHGEYVFIRLPCLLWRGHPSMDWSGTKANGDEYECFFATTGASDRRSEVPACVPGGTTNVCANAACSSTIPIQNDDAPWEPACYWPIQSTYVDTSVGNPWSGFRFPQYSSEQEEGQILSGDNSFAGDNDDACYEGLKLDNIILNAFTGEQVDLWIYPAVQEPISSFQAFNNMVGGPPARDCDAGCTGGYF